MAAARIPLFLAGLIVLASSQAVLADEVTVSTYSALVNAVNGAPSAGRTISLTPGTYTQSGVLWISDKPNLTIQGATGNPQDVILLGQGINSSQHHNIGIDTCPNFTVQHVTLKNTYYHGISVNDASHYCTIRNCILWDNGESGVKATHQYNSSSARYSDYGLIENCRIGFTTQGARSVVEGVDLIATKGWIIRNNVFVNVTMSGNVAYGCFPKGNAQDSIIENNYFFNCDIAASFGGGGTGADYFRDGQTTYEHRNGIIRNNIMVGGGDAAVYLNKSLNAKVYNNVAYAHGLTFQGRFAETSASFRNNIAVNCSDSLVVRWRDSAVNLGSSNNVFGSAAWFVAPADSESADFHLTASATAAINTGYALPADVPTDRDGRARPQGAGWDLGPYEYLPPNSNPTINAGPDQTAYEGQTVHLHATADDANGDPLTYDWGQIAGQVCLNPTGATTPDFYVTMPTLTSRMAAVMTFRALVDDSRGGTANDTVDVQAYMAGDINHDWYINVGDLQLLVAAWNTQGAGLPTDLNVDGYVNVGDLQILVANWGRSL